MTPLLTPLSKLFQSRKFLLALAVAVVGTLCTVLPDLRPYYGALTGLFAFCFGLVFLHLSLEDLIKMFKDIPPDDKAAEDLVSSVAAIVLDALKGTNNPDLPARAGDPTVQLPPANG